MRRFLQELHAVHRPLKDSFYQRTAGPRDALFAAIKAARNRLLDDLFARVAAARPESAPLARLRARIYSYFDRSDWAMLDLVALAACTTVPVDQAAAALAPNALVYHSLRMLDDVLDGHHDYKGGAKTLFGELMEDGDAPHLAAHANLLTAMIVMASTTAALTGDERQLLERTLIGMLHESFPGEWRSPESYRQIAAAKMGAYGLFLYRPIVGFFEPAAQQTLEPFLVRSFVISQFVNDLQDREDDDARRQPNYWLMDGPDEARAADFRREIDVLACSCAEIPRPARDYAHTRVTDLAAYCLQVLETDDQRRRHRAVEAS
jgi:hypothetical protein